ncbi:hypothetical protein WKH56_06500 [Priestia sp. SB1]|uniref:hypothetical protein n=1 Tax=Priestia sp. SB1 TaxID=3132359 RepID=UPI003180B99E
MSSVESQQDKYFNKMTLLSGMVGSGKTYAIREIVKKKIATNKTYIIQHTNDFGSLCEELKGNLIVVNNVVEINMFGFYPASYTSGDYYSYLFDCHCKELFVFLKLLLERDMGNVEKVQLMSAILEMYESVGITKGRFNPNYEYAPNHLCFSTFCEVLKEHSDNLYKEFKVYSPLMVEDKNISNYFGKKNRGLDLKNNLNLIYTNGMYSLAVLYSYVVAIKRKMRIEPEPTLLVVDEGFLFLKDEHLLETLILNSGASSVQTELLISIQSLTDLSENLNEILSAASKVILFRQGKNETPILESNLKLPKNIVRQTHSLLTGEAMVIENKHMYPIKYS